MAATAEVKIVIVGDGAVGKTALMIMYSQGTFPVDYIPTVYDDYNKSETYKDQLVNLVLWDTAGQEEYDAIRTLSYDKTNVFLVAFCCTQRESLLRCKTKWYPELKKYFSGEPPPIVLVGTKCDLRDMDPSSPNAVKDNEIKEIMRDIGAKAYITCSAKSGIRVAEVFKTALDVHFEKDNQSEGCCSIL
ncbi:Rac3c, Rho family GTPase [Monocercomonoides exilis]|uniref:Rac3c, Rho family GTPase n=1 Tax=Monocercomonoides exilis TaxID=2049356 RepID=UPI003559458F|nr:Rac3c, Rho family GTPase [Monocercomonoides exilis]|eukprot:MONOS_1980.1-p1 / transcript=MONOS_1980.1 / gene=MONOS_1980 / organism=Monocercomonoides_exilis_PA203 / gene_product=Rac3c, Rho family GTPase / transcript_product=Rac3c, Rho family GTPase / location=Mono_scaffold00038:50484-51697(-) / protein_length=189 / sequence_SO=supercontig / SO=protein_coding / is_pseudo=false